MSNYETYSTINPNGEDGNGLDTIEHDPSDTPVIGAKNPKFHQAFLSPDGKFSANVWACDAGTIEIDGLAIDEACFLIEGEVHMTDKSGRTTIYKAGDAFMLPKGFCGTWHMPYPIRKYNCMYTR